MGINQVINNVVNSKDYETQIVYIEVLEERKPEYGNIEPLLNLVIEESL
mgnify:CR=1 FL=1